MSLLSDAERRAARLLALALGGMLLISAGIAGTTEIPGVLQALALLDLGAMMQAIQVSLLLGAGCLMCFVLAVFLSDGTGSDWEGRGQFYEDLELAEVLRTPWPAPSSVEE